MISTGDVSGQSYQLYLDENPPLRLVGLLQPAGHIVHTARSEGNLGWGDPAQLLYAAERGWILVTHDLDFINLHDAWMRWRSLTGGRAHAGILLLRGQQGSYRGEVAARAIESLLASAPNLRGRLLVWTEAEGWRPGALFKQLLPPLDEPLGDS